jgi:hypothetical protein
MRELAATLILRPPGFDTLPVRIWIHTMDVGPVPTAALLALVLVAIVAVPWLALVTFDGAADGVGATHRTSVTSGSGRLAAQSPSVATDAHPEGAHAVPYRS